jgi:hypothetical protein
MRAVSVRQLLFAGGVALLSPWTGASEVLDTPLVPDRVLKEFVTNFHRQQAGIRHVSTRYSTITPVRQGWVRKFHTKSDSVWVEVHYAEGKIHLTTSDSRAPLRTIPFRFWYSLGSATRESDWPAASVPAAVEPFGKVPAERQWTNGPLPDGRTVYGTLDLPRNAFPESPRIRGIVARTKGGRYQYGDLSTELENLKRQCVWENSGDRATIGNSFSEEIVLLDVMGRPLPRSARLHPSGNAHAAEYGWPPLRVWVRYLPADQLRPWHDLSRLAVTRLTHCRDFLNRFADLSEIAVEKYEP